MRRVGQVRRRDANEKPIREALEAAGADVTPISGKGAPDLLVRFRGRLYAFEVKNPKGYDTITPAQQETAWPVVHSEQDALYAIGARRRPPSPDGAP